MARCGRGVYEAGPARLPIVARSVHRSTARPDTLAQTVPSIRIDAVARRARTIHFLTILSGAQDLDFHGLAAEGALKLPDLGVRLPQLTGGDHILTRLDGRRRPGLREPLPVADDTR